MIRRGVASLCDCNFPCHHCIRAIRAIREFTFSERVLRCRARRKFSVRVPYLPKKYVAMSEIHMSFPEWPFHACLLHVHKALSKQLVISGYGCSNLNHQARVACAVEASIECSFWCCAPTTCSLRFKSKPPSLQAAALNLQLEARDHRCTSGF